MTPTERRELIDHLTRASKHAMRLAIPEDIGGAVSLGYPRVHDSRNGVPPGAVHFPIEFWVPGPPDDTSEKLRALWAVVVHPLASVGACTAWRRTTRPGDFFGPPVDVAILEVTLPEGKDAEWLSGFMLGLEGGTQ